MRLDNKIQTEQTIVNIDNPNIEKFIKNGFISQWSRSGNHGNYFQFQEIPKWKKCIS